MNIINIIKAHPFMTPFFVGGIITSVGIGIMSESFGAGLLSGGITMIICATLAFMGQYKDQDFR